MRAACAAAPDRPGAGGGSPTHPARRGSPGVFAVALPEACACAAVGPEARSPQADAAPRRSRPMRPGGPNGRPALRRPVLRRPVLRRRGVGAGAWGTGGVSLVVAPKACAVPLAPPNACAVSLVPPKVCAGPDVMPKACAVPLITPKACAAPVVEPEAGLRQEVGVAPPRRSGPAPADRPGGRMVLRRRGRSSGAGARFRAAGPGGVLGTEAARGRPGAGR